jgi:hypothetical protein
LSLAKLGRMSTALRNLSLAITSRRYEFFVTMGLALCLLLFGATALYWIEGPLQPDKFGSIPRALWWSVITLTTIGYGDVYPRIPAGKFVAGLFAIAGVGVIALPTGILAAAFSDAVQRGMGRNNGTMLGRRLSHLTQLRSKLSLCAARVHPATGSQIAQSTTIKPGTRVNSRVFAVISVVPTRRACAAINTS